MSDFWRTIQNDENPCKDDVERMVQSLQEEWTPETDVHAWALSMLDLGEQHGFADIVEQASSLSNLIQKVHEAFRSHEWEDARDQLAKEEVIDLAMQRCHLCKNLLTVNMAIVGDQPLPASMRPPTAVEQRELKIPFQRVYVFALERLQFYGYRRLGEKCYVEKKTPESVPTHAYEEVCTIMDFIQRICNRVENPDEWEDLFSSKCSIGDDVKKQLQRCEDPSFPELVPNPDMYSFNNGMYVKDQHQFYKWDDKGRWQEQADAYNRDVYDAQGLGDSNVFSRARPPCRMDVAIKYFDTHFPCEYMNDADNVPTPEMDQIMQNQNWEEGTMHWAYVLFGRLFYMVGEKDNWQKIPFIKGVAGCGKSTICNALRFVLPVHDVGTVGHEDKFMLASMYKCKLWMCTEVRHDAPEFFVKKQGDFQSMITGEDVPVAIKFGDQKSVKIEAQGILAGNEFFGVDASGSLARRVMSFECPEFIPQDRLDPLLFDNIKAGIGALILKINFKYLTEAHKHGREDLAKPGTLPEQILQFQKNLANNIDGMTAFLSERKEEGLITYKDLDDINAPDVFMKYADFSTRYLRFRENRGMPKTTVTPEHCAKAFNEYGIRIIKDRRDCGDQLGVVAKWVSGIGIASEHDS